MAKPALKPAGVRSIKRVREAADTQSSSLCNPRTILPWLIDNHVVLPSSKVRYISRKNGRPLKEGQVFREGIRCSCCYQIYSLSAFEAHAGSSLHRPSANIYLEDGRSLTECQRQLLTNARKLNSGKELNEAAYPPNNDDLCSVCHCEGELMLCDGCPSSFHIACLGLNVCTSFLFDFAIYLLEYKLFFMNLFDRELWVQISDTDLLFHFCDQEVPDGDWFCSSCCCLFCGQGESQSNISEKGVLRCYQCEHQCTTVTFAFLIYIEHIYL